MSNTYCTLCGVPIGVSKGIYNGRLLEDDLKWTTSFRALVQRRGRNKDGGDNTPYEWCLTGLGIRLKDGIADFESLEQEHHMAAFTDRGTSYDICYPFHDLCWDILLQKYAEASTGRALDLTVLGRIFMSQTLDDTESGLQADWSDCYDAIDDFWPSSGAGWMGEVEIDDDELSQWDYLVREPTAVSGFDNQFQYLLRIVEGPKNSLRGIFPSPATCKEIFSRLPPEIKTNIMCLLPTSSVTAVRLASRAMAEAPLSATYWRSRFAFPHELCHVFLQPLISSVSDLDEIDWKYLCSKLLHPTGGGFDWWKNRKRILSLNERLVHRILNETGSSDDQEDYKFDILDGSVCRQRFFGLETESYKSVALFNYKDIWKISAVSKYYHSTGMNHLTGIIFHQKEEDVKLGNCEKRLSSVVLGAGQFLVGLVLGVHPKGLVGIKIIVSDNEGQIHTLESSLGATTEIDGAVALKRMIATNDCNVHGFRAGFAADDRIISLDLFESREKMVSNIDARREVGPLLENMWSPTLPPLDVTATAASGFKYENVFKHSRNFIYASDEADLKHLTRISSFTSLPPRGLEGLQFHFDDDRSPIPEHMPRNGTQVDFCIDGAGGERIISVEISWSESTGSVAISFITNRGRRSPVSRAFMNLDIHTDRQKAPPDTFISGIYADICVGEKENGSPFYSYQGIGLICSHGMQSSMPSEQYPADYVSRYDDHSNAWAGESIPPSWYLPGETIGSQPRDGFINWIPIGNPILKVTAYVGSLSPYLLGFNDLIGLRFDQRRSSLPTILGKSGREGSTFELEPDDKIKDVVVTTTTRRFMDTIITGIKFSSQHEKSSVTLTGVGGQRDGNQLSDILLRDTPALKLVGIGWSFDMQNRSQGLQPFYELKDESRRVDLHTTLYPSLKWDVPPPNFLQLRPVPAMQLNAFSFTSSVRRNEISEWSQLAEADIISIHVYYNYFLQGITFRYKDGVQRSVGNLVGIKHEIVLECGEIIDAVRFYEQVEAGLPMPPPGEQVAVNGICFRLVKPANTSLAARYSPIFGCSKPFGPFINRQQGLWNANSGGSAEWKSCFKQRTFDIDLERTSSFAGIYCESLSTCIRRAGVLTFRINAVHDANFKHSLQSWPTPSYSPDSNGQSPWLGPPPPDTVSLSPLAGISRGTYRIWCPAPQKLSKITVYRHKPSNLDHDAVIIGIELHDTKPGNSFLLGFRSLWMDHAIIFQFEDHQNDSNESHGEGSNMIGLSVGKAVDYDLKGGLTTLQVLFSPAFTAAGTDATTIIQAHANKSVVGLYAYMDERIQGIGLIEG